MNVLVVYYSQSGQLEAIARNIASPFLNSADINVMFHEIELEKPFPFPWSSEAFFDAFPETFLQIPTKLKTVSAEILNTKFDLILLNYQVWYLSPSIPITSFLKSPEAKIILNNTPVVTISGSRNMWVMAQEKVKVLIQNNGAQLSGNIALVDRAGNLISVVTIVQWMFTGVKKRYLGIFPLPGISEKEIQESSKFGEIILNSLRKDELSQVQSKLLEFGAVSTSPFLIFMDKTANKLFAKWSDFIIKRSRHRTILLKIFKIYLLVAIYLISPIVFILHTFLYAFQFNKIRRETQYCKGV